MDEAKELIDADIENTMDDDIGDIHVADEVICIVASLAAQEVPGVYSMSGGITDELNSFLGKEESASKGVRLRYEGKQVHVIVYLNLEYGYCFPEVALAVQEKVKKAVEEMTDYEVQFVDVHVEGVMKPSIPDKLETQGSADAMADIMQAQAKRAEATEENSYEMQLMNHADDIEAVERAKALSSVQRSLPLYTEYYDDDDDDDEVVGRERKYFQIGEEDSSVSAEERHRKFWEED
ncbi:MAG: Asp23/Gls24 family envelope stress response protein [Phascolarctobacterium sp.]|nr:Asp23/Gls24 family envelope stress response protein [Phascolarctobacterium sp.]